MPTKVYLGGSSYFLSLSKRATTILWRPWYYVCMRKLGAWEAAKEEAAA